RLGRYRQRKLEVRSGRTTLPKQCFERGRDLQLWPLPSRLCSRTTIEQVMGGFDQGVAESAIQLAAIVLTGGLRQRFEGSPESCAAFGIEDAADPNHAALAGGQRQRTSFDPRRLVACITFGVGRMARVITEVAKARHAVLSRLVQQAALIERFGRPLGLGDGGRRTCDQG